MSSGLHIFTSAAVNYLPKVRTLCRSIRRHHPEATIHLALADERPDWLSTDGEPFDSILEIGSLSIPDWRAWSFMHNIVELATAIKPFALAHLLARPDCHTVVYFDPDMVLFSPVEDLLQTLRESNVALTPHQTTPERTLDNVIDNEITSLKMGVFNLGFIGVANTDEGKRFAAWWSERCYHFCRAEVANGLFTDQKWVNFVPIFFDGVAIVKSPRHNVATWNLTTRTLVGSVRAGFTVDGLPLGFYHFTGFDSGAHRLMALKNAPGNTALQELIGWYEKDTQPEPGDRVVGWPWGFANFTNGERVQPSHRWVYRDRRDLQKTFPDPYDAQPGKFTFLEWCETEGRIRYPELFGPYATKGAPVPSRLESRMTFGMAAKLLLLAFAPRAGRPLRQRLVRMLRTEGLGGIRRRLRRLHA
jgi:hypothetical protein